RGFALVLSILAVVLIGALIVATHVAVTLEHSVASASIARQRAFAASEHGLWSSVSAWDSTNSALYPGQSRNRVVRAGSDSSVVTTVRLGERTFWVMSESNVDNARRRTALNVRQVTDSAGPRVEPVARSWVELH
ncbi:MAG TPA: hypothetical protein VMY38_01865, partial [Gemmatimonadaceae bacterium]|nr:hypothetical protein [Gemmatimonadaceae bacterium]